MPEQDEQLREFLRAQDSGWLADELLAAARVDPLLRAQLDVAAGAGSRVAYDDRVLRRRLERAIEVDRLRRLPLRPRRPTLALALPDPGGQ